MDAARYERLSRRGVDNRDFVVFGLLVFMKIARKENEALDTIRAVFSQRPDAVKDCENIKGEIFEFWYDVAYGVTPSIFVFYKAEGDEFLERVRLEK